MVTGAPTHEALSLAPNLRFLIAVLKIKLCLLNGSYMASHKDTSFVYFIVNCELTASDQWETGWAQELHLLTRTRNSPMLSDNNRNAEPGGQDHS